MVKQLDSEFNAKNELPLPGERVGWESGRGVGFGGVETFHNRL